MHFKLMKVSASKTNTGEGMEFTCVYKAEVRIELKILEAMRARYKTDTRRTTCCPWGGGDWKD